MSLNSSNENTLNYNNKTIFHFFILSLATVIFFLPSGWVFGVPIKLMALFALVVCVFISQIYALISSFIVFSAVALFFIPSFVIGVDNWQSLALRELQMLTVPFFVPLLVFNYLKNFYAGDDSSIACDAMSIFKSMLVLVALQKIIMVCYVFLGLGSVQALQGIYFDVFGSEFISLDILKNLPRVFISSDSAIAFFPFIYAYFIKNNFSKDGFLKVLLFLAVCAFVVFFSYSRFIWLLFGLGTFFLIQSLRFSLVVKSTIYSLILLLALVLAVLAKPILEERFSAKHNQSSDGIRIQQYYALQDLWRDSPILGQGLGAYNKDYIRSELEPYSYELQIFSLLPKLGLLGFAVLFCGLLLLVSLLIVNGQLYLTMLVGIIGFAGLTNPYVFSTNFSIVILLLGFYIYRAIK